MFCEACGSRHATDGMFCSVCGQSRSDSARWTGGGTATQVVPPPPMVATGAFPVPQTAGSGYSTAAIIMGALAFLFFPIVLGPQGSSSAPSPSRKARRTRSWP